MVGVPLDDGNSLWIRFCFSHGRVLSCWWLLFILLLTCHSLNLFIIVRALGLALEKSKSRGVVFVAC